MKCQRSADERAVVNARVRNRSAVLIAILALSLQASAQTAVAPAAYTLRVDSRMQGGMITVRHTANTTVIDHAAVPAHGNWMATPPSRVHFDLAHGRSYQWNPDDPTSACGDGTFQGDIGDPFELGRSIDLKELNAKDLGADTVNGMAAQKYAVKIDGHAATVWVDLRNALTLKLAYPQSAQPNKPATAEQALAAMGAAMFEGTLVEVTSVDFSAPNKKFFQLPASCAALASQPAKSAQARDAQMQEQRDTALKAAEQDSALVQAKELAKLTGGQPGDFVEVQTGLGGAEHCDVEFRVAQAKTRQPISDDWIVEFSTQETKNGKVSVQSVPGVKKGGFYVVKGLSGEINVNISIKDFSTGTGFSLQCFDRPTARLLYVMSDPQNPMNGRNVFVWRKAPIPQAPRPQ